MTYARLCLPSGGGGGPENTATADIAKCASDTRREQSGTAEKHARTDSLHGPHSIIVMVTGNVRPAAAIRLVLAAVLAAAGTGAHPLVYRSTMDALEYLEHVLMNERHWTPVLAERVKNLGPPPYHQDGRFAEHLIADEYLADGWVLDPRTVVVDVVRDRADMRSFVEYAGRTLHAALTCHTFRHLAFQAHYVWLLLTKRADAGLVMLEAGRLRETTAVMLDKLAAYPADLQPVLDAYWEAVRLIQSPAPQMLRDNRYPDGAKEPVQVLHGRFAEHLARECEPFAWDKRFFDACGIPVTDNQVYDKVLILNTTVDAITRIGRAHADYVSAYYDQLNLDTLPRALWRQIFYYAKTVPRGDRLNETNLPITAAAARRQLVGTIVARPSATDTDVLVH